MSSKNRIVNSDTTVGELIETLRQFPAEARVRMFSDAEGNNVHPLDYVATDGSDVHTTRRVYLIPQHG